MDRMGKMGYRQIRDAMFSIKSEHVTWQLYLSLVINSPAKPPDVSNKEHFETLLKRAKAAAKVYLESEK